MTAQKEKTWIASRRNSDGVRIPRSLMRRPGFSTGDRIGIFVNERGNIEIERETKPAIHRRVKPTPWVTFESLFVGYILPNDIASLFEPFPDDMEGAELESWSK